MNLVIERPDFRWFIRKHRSCDDVDISAAAICGGNQNVQEELNENPTCNNAFAGGLRLPQWSRCC